MKGILSAGMCECECLFVRAVIYTAIMMSSFSH